MFYDSEAKSPDRGDLPTKVRLPILTSVLRNEPDLSRSVLRLRVEGSLMLTRHAGFQRRIATGAGLLVVRGVELINRN
jgi:hypothetical protein